MIAILAGIRAIHFASLMALWGGCGFIALLKSQLAVTLPAPPLKKAVAGASLVALVTAVLWLMLATGQMSGDWGMALDPKTIWTVGSETRFGHIALARLGGLILMSILSFFPMPSVAFAGVGAILLCSLSLTSHAAASDGSLGLALAFNDALHLLTAGFWVGGLLALAQLVRLRRDDSKNLTAALRLFSAWGVLGVGVLVLTGIINAAAILPIKSLSSSVAYDDILAAKIALALSMIALAAINRTQLLPSLHNGEPGAVKHLKRNIAAEIGIGALIVAIVGYLGMISPS